MRCLLVCATVNLWLMEIYRILNVDWQLEMHFNSIDKINEIFENKNFFLYQKVDKQYSASVKTIICTSKEHLCYNYTIWRFSSLTYVKAANTLNNHVLENMYWIWHTFSLKFRKPRKYLHVLIDYVCHRNIVFWWCYNKCITIDPIYWHDNVTITITDWTTNIFTIRKTNL